ncbi:MAG TPA: hypothetical protein VMZ29_00170 [Candidatus Bathyarchaeia archaeon]|nr:hypothetical protein [Candidatus Bathyarchaeia archaeon]
MTDYKKDPIRSQARRDVLKAIGDKEIINKFEIVEETALSPLTINSILREFRNYKIITCHAGGMYALSGEGREFYFQILNDKKYRKKDYDRRVAELSEEENRVIHTIYIDEEEPPKNE